MSRSKRSVRDAILNLLVTFGLVAIAMLAAEVEPIRALGAHVDEVIKGQSWWLPLMIALAVIGGLLMLGAQFLPEPRRHSPPSDAELDGDAVPIAFHEEHRRSTGLLSHSFFRGFEAEASLAQVREAWRRHAWRYSRKWRIFFVMMLGALLVTLGLVGIMIAVMPMWVTLLMLGLLIYVGIRMFWAR